MDGRLQGAAVGGEINRAVGGGNHQAYEYPLVGRDHEPGGPGSVITDAIVPRVSQLAHAIYGCGGVPDAHAALARTGARKKQAGVFAALNAWRAIGVDPGGEGRGVGFEVQRRER